MTRYEFRAVNGKVVLILTGTGRDEGNAKFVIGDAIDGKLFAGECIRASREAAEQRAPRLVGGER